jgi:hypothetical protein
LLCGKEKINHLPLKILERRMTGSPLQYIYVRRGGYITQKRDKLLWN